MTSNSADGHVDDLVRALRLLDQQQVAAWGQKLAGVLANGGRLLVAGNGGSAAQAQHLSAELVGRFRADRPGYSALALHADTSTLTAVGNDYGFEEIYARQVDAHGRPGDVLLVLSTSGRSQNLVRAVGQAREVGMTSWALTGPEPNVLAAICDEHLCVDGDAPTVQECHLVVIHLLCSAVDQGLCPVKETAEPELLVKTNTPASNRKQTSASQNLPANEPVRLVVVGDLLVDETWDGEVERVAPEAPAPVVQSPQRSLHPGGAGLAALFAAHDGHDVTLITAHCGDSAALNAVGALSTAGVKVVNLGTTSPTPVKTRVRSGNQLLVMIDNSSPASAPGPWTELAQCAAQEAQAILVSDYGRGLTAAADLRATLSGLAVRIPVVWDPHPRGSTPIPGVQMVTPNSREAAHFAHDDTVGSFVAPAYGHFVSGHSTNGHNTSGHRANGHIANGYGAHRYSVDGPNAPELSADAQRARFLARLWGAQHVVVTRGRHGAVMVSAVDGAAVVVPAPWISSGDSCGAGDRFAVVLAHKLALGATPASALSPAVAAATTHVAGGMGCARGLEHNSEHDQTTVVGADALALAAAVRESGGTVVATGGCFDLLHRGHVSLLEQARLLGDFLVVCVNSDESVTRLKGAGRPLVPVEDRVAVLLGLACVDAVLVFSEDTPVRALTSLRPHIWVKGGDYVLGELPEQQVVEAGGGQVVLLPYLDGHSTTGLLHKVVSTTVPVDACARLPFAVEPR